MGLKDIFSWIVGTGVGVTAMPMLDKMVTGHAPQTAAAIGMAAAGLTAITALAAFMTNCEPDQKKLLTGMAAGAIAYIGATFAVPSERPQQEIFFRKPAAFGALAIPGQAAGRGSFKFSLA